MNRKKLKQILYNGISKIKSKKDIHVAIHKIAKKILFYQREKSDDNFIDFILKVPKFYCKKFYSFLFEELILSWKKRQTISIKKLIFICFKTFTRFIMIVFILSLVIQFSLESLSPEISILILLLLIAFLIKKNMKKIF